MKVKVQVVLESDCGETEIIQQLAQLQREPQNPEPLGLTLAEAKVLLQNLQRKIVEQQVSEDLEQQAIWIEVWAETAAKRQSLYRGSNPMKGS